jgi:adenylate cyclase
MNSSGFNRKLTTIFSADVAGYSRLMGEDEAATVKTLTAYRKILSELIKQHRGRVIDSPGDNLLAEFTSVVDAVQCAVSVQKEIQARNAELPENRRMEFRIGVNLGDVIEEEDRIYGDGVNIAARLEGLADPGGICISKTAFDHIESKLPLGYEFLGEKEVKNIAKPVGAYRVLMEPRITVATGKSGRKKAISGWWRKTAIVAGVLILFLAATAAVIWNIYFRLPDVERFAGEKIELKLPEGPSIAVLPFVNMTGDPDQEYFSDGLTENIITGLSSVPKLFVIARNSTFFYKGKAVKVQEIAKELGVQYVVEGSVQKSSNRFRMTAQLIDAKTGRHVWAEHYDRELKEIFAIQDEITIKIIKALRLKLTDGMVVQEVDRYPSSLEAFMKMMKGLEYLYMGNKEANILAREESEQAIALAPQHPLPYSIIALSHVGDLMCGAKHPVISLAKATQSAKKGITLDDSYPGNYLSLAFIAFARGEHEKAITFSEKAIALNPSSAPGYWLLGMTFNYSERPDKGIEYLKKSIRLNPKPQAVFLSSLSSAYWMSGQNKKAIAMCKKAVDQSPDLIACWGFLTAIYMSSGQEEDARAAAKEVLRIDPDFSVERFAKSRPYKKQADRDRLIDALRKAGLK